jgi:hypothetical protein
MADLSHFSILQAMDEPRIWGGWFRDKRTWKPWRAFLSALFGLPLSAEALEVFRACTGRADAPKGGATEAWLVCGRRAGKSFVLALIACYLAIFRDWQQYLAPGELGSVKIIATDRRQARVIHRFCRALLTKVPVFQELIQRDSDDEILLTNGICIEIQTASYRSVRGFAVVAALLDEMAFWRADDSFSNPDTEILAALRPAMATVPGAFLLAASSPYARRGVLWKAWRDNWGKDTPAICWQAATRTMNPTVPQKVIDDALAEDPSKAAAEYLAEFRQDIETFVSRDVVEDAIIAGRHELSPADGIAYHAFVDPSGASVDSMTLAVTHREPATDVVILDAVLEHRPPFSPESVCTEFAGFIKQYRIREISGDRWGGEWPREQFQKNGIKYNVSEHAKTAIYTEFLPVLNSGRVELLDHPRLITQLCSLERRTGRGSGRDVIDHPPGAHDDLANAVAGAVVLAAAGHRGCEITPELLAAAKMPPVGGRSADSYGRSLWAALPGVVGNMTAAQYAQQPQSISYYDLSLVRQR